MYSIKNIKEVLLAHLVSREDEGLLFLNSSFEIIYVSPQLCKLTGCAADELRGMPLDRLFPAHADGLRAAFMQEEIPYTTRFYKPLKCKGSKAISTRIRLAKGNDNQGNLIFIMFVKDNTAFQRFRNDIIRKALTIEALAKSRTVRNGQRHAALYEIIEMASRALRCSRVNTWLIDEQRTKIKCIAAYDSGRDVWTKDEELRRLNLPQYFDLFETEKIIITMDALTNPRTAEIRESYIKPHGISSMMDIPLRLEGDVIGVVCFEHTDGPRDWNIQEQTFGLVVAQMISLALETSRRKEACDEAAVALKEKELLLRELQHRVTNNLAVIGGLITIQEQKVRDDFHRELFRDLRNRVDSISTIHQLLRHSRSYHEIDIRRYLSAILENLVQSFPGYRHNVQLAKHIDDAKVDVSVAVPMALITTELVTNAFKYAFPDDDKGNIEVSFRLRNGMGLLKVRDNGKGFQLRKNEKPAGGIDIVRTLCQQINGALEFSGRNGSSFQLKFPFPRS